METTVEKKHKKLNAKNSEVVKRKDGFSIDPSEIVVLWDTNERSDYGEDEDWQAFKDSIRERGVLQNLKLFIRDGKWHLRHGFRRMKAILELREEGYIIERVSFDEVLDNEEDALVDHFILNSGKNLNDVEMANALQKLKVMMGTDNAAALAKRVSLPYQKVINLLSFAEKAGTQLKKAVLDGETSFDVGRKIANTAKSVTEQNKLLNEGKQVAQKDAKNGKVKIRSKHIPIIHQVVSDGTPFDDKLVQVMAEAKAMDKLDRTFYNRFAEIVRLIRMDAPSQEIMLMFIP